MNVFRSRKLEISAANGRGECKLGVMVCVCTAALSLLAYQGATKADCDLRDAYPKAIDWDSTLKFGTSSTYDANIGSPQTGTYTLSRDLVTGRFVMDLARQSVFDLGEGRTMTIIGSNTGPAAIGFTTAGSGSMFQLKSGNIVFPYTHPDVTTTYPILGIPRADNKPLHDAQCIVGGGSTEATLTTRDIQMLYGTNNWLVVTNNGRVVVSGAGIKFCNADASDGTGTRNGIRVTEGGVISNSEAGVALSLALFGRADSKGNVFEVTDGGRLDGWERFALQANAGNMLAFRGSATHQVFHVTNATVVCTFNGKGGRLEVTDGARLEVTTGASGRGRIWVGTSDSSWSNVLYVAGVGSSFSCAATPGNLIGQANSEGNRVEVRDNATASMPATHIGQNGSAAKPAKGNVVRVTDGGTFTDSQGLVVGYGENNTTSHVCSNRLEVASGGVVNTVRLQVGFATHSWGNLVDVDGGTVDVTRNFVFGRFGHDSHVKVSNGGKVTVGEEFTFGYYSEGFASNNVMEVLSGGEVVANEFIAYGTNHTLVVSNGTIRTRDVTSNGIQLPWFDNSRDWDFTLEVAGTNPVLRAEGTTAGVYTFGIRRGAKVLFRVPYDGYVEPPLQAAKGQLSIFDDGNGNVPDVRFDVSACGGHSVQCVIAEGNPLRITAVAMDKMKSNLPENCKLKVVDNRLILKVNEFGTNIIFR